MKSESPATTRLLVVFAVKEEAHPFEKLAGFRSDLRILITGMGPRNAERGILEALSDGAPSLVLTCGFAGGLNPELTTGAVVFSADEGFGPTSALLDAGARPATFHCAESVAVTAVEKRALRKQTGADAVEMESGVIRAICRERGIPAATLRVISDPVDEDLPLDFNRLLDAQQNLSLSRLVLALLSAPWKIGGLLKLQRQTRTAAENLALVLAGVISDRAPER